MNCIPFAARGDAINDQEPATERRALDPRMAQNPAKNGKSGKIGLLLLFVGGGIAALFLILDTIQFLSTGHESGAFNALTRAALAPGVVGLLITAYSSYLKIRH